MFSNLVGSQNIWGAKGKNRLLTPSPRDSDIDLEMDSGTDPFSCPTIPTPSPKIISVGMGAPYAVKIGRGEVGLKGYISGSRSL